MAHSSIRVSKQRQRKGVRKVVAMVFYNLTSRVPFQHFCHILLVKSKLLHQQDQPTYKEKKIHRGVTMMRKDHWEPFQKQSITVFVSFCYCCMTSHHKHSGLKWKLFSLIHICGSTGTQPNISDSSYRFPYAWILVVEWVQVCFIEVPAGVPVKS